MTDRELMQMALDALERGRPQIIGVLVQQDQDAAIEAIRAALAQGEPEPVTTLFGSLPVYDTAPPQQNKFNPDWDAMAVMVEEQQRMSKRIEELEAALAQGEPKHEPIAVVDTQGRLVWIEGNQFFPEKPIALYDAVIYTAPPQREWQGLTDEEINTIAATPAAIPGSYVHSFARAIEAKLKEKNA